MTNKEIVKLVLSPETLAVLTTEQLGQIIFELQAEQHARENEDVPTAS